MLKCLGTIPFLVHGMIFLAVLRHTQKCSLRLLNKDLTLIVTIGAKKHHRCVSVPVGQRLHIVLSLAATKKDSTRQV